MIDAVFRPLSDGDRVLLGQATLGNVNWNGDRFTLDQVRETEALAHYLEFDPERGDIGIVAERDGRAVGVAWVFFLPAENPGFGYVDADIPELSLWVHPNARGQGLGRQLLRELLDASSQRAIDAVSLSVEEGNFARQLYLSEGFKDVPGSGVNGVMVRQLRR